ncbi:7TM diverse intracellular signaling domain-containing protein [Aridibaculum aurantiacum]|uniref:7TM diverse intracellular signaling domain-containing protein n=1 Tax=Aridibaculum aurantiacum TaxID=2810307 RepID=UPI001A966791|nr:7TM diverse intracellular signaling domain-containing protein [Aridibaculum aurantiacum]
MRFLSGSRHWPRFIFSGWMWVICFCLLNYASFANPSIVKVTSSDNAVSIAPYLQQYIDPKDKVSTLESVLSSAEFTPFVGEIPNYGLNTKSVWLRFTVKNNTPRRTLYLEIPYTNLSQLKLYHQQQGNFALLAQDGNTLPIQEKVAATPNYVLDLQLPPGAQKEFILHVYSNHPVILPAFVGSDVSVHKSNTLLAFIVSSYMGILLIMFVYNLFLFMVTRDKNYFYYTLYIFLVALAQLAMSGYGYMYFWPAFTEFNKYSVIWTSSLSAIAGIVFSMFFLRTKHYSPRLHNILLALIGIYIIGMISCLLGGTTLSYMILNYNSLLVAIALLSASIYIARQGFRSAYFYLIAWLALLLSFIVLILRNLNVMPYNTFTAYVFYMGSAIEVALLSIALADRINTLRREKEASQAEALNASRENVKLVREQNMILERKVAERTEELQETNEQLSEAFKELKDAQIQLVEAEKMASLGQLTAGIAHEINNPINFVKSNIKPLQLDFADMVEVIDAYEKLHTLEDEKIASQLKNIIKLKQELDIDFLKSEIDSLLNGIKDGAERTAEIVRGLRTFSRLDESQIKTVNIHEGIESTLVLLRNSSPDHVKITMDFKADGNIECFPGKLNQVFMNIISNAIQAIKGKANKQPEFINISTTDVGEDAIEIRIKDSGPGMSAEVKQKIFEPFFTTKDVGEGTGLGLAIVFKIIQEHSGKIDVMSAEGEGAEFIIQLHRIIPEKPSI